MCSLVYLVVWSSPTPKNNFHLSPESLVRYESVDRWRRRGNRYLWKQFGNKFRLRASQKYLVTVKLKKPIYTKRVGGFRFEVGDGFGAKPIKLGKTNAACCETMVLSNVVNMFSGFVSLGGAKTKLLDSSAREMLELTNKGNNVIEAKVQGGDCTEMDGLRSV
ncbi:hypothetical protein V6N13_138497 [Hibiscus sabdariffa]